MWLLKRTHKHIGRDTLSEYLDGRLQWGDLERVEEQLEECSSCRLELEELQATVAMIRQLPMEAPRRSFLMSAPPPEPARRRPALALRAPNWVYAGAVSVAALALAVTISLDATGGLSSDPLRRDAALTAMAPAPTLERATTTSESAATSASQTEGDEAVPPQLAAAAPTAATASQTAPEEQAAAGTPNLEFAITPLPTPAPLAASAPEAQDSEATIIQSARAEPTFAVVVPDDSVLDGSQALGPKSTTDAWDTSDMENKATEASTSEAPPAKAPAPVPKPVESTVFDEEGGSGTSIWWRLLEVATSVVGVAFLAALLLRWRTNRRDLA